MYRTVDASWINEYCTNSVRRGVARQTNSNTTHLRPGTARLQHSRWRRPPCRKRLVSLYMKTVTHDPSIDQCRADPGIHTHHFVRSPTETATTQREPGTVNVTRGSSADAASPRSPIARKSGTAPRCTHAQLRGARCGHRRAPAAAIACATAPAPCVVKVRPTAPTKSTILGQDLPGGAFSCLGKKAFKRVRATDVFHRWPPAGSLCGCCWCVSDPWSAFVCTERIAHCIFQPFLRRST